MNIVPFNLAGAPRIGLDEAKKSFDRAANVIFVDVRPQADYEKSHIFGSVNIPLRDVPRRVGELPPEAEIITY